MRWFACLLIVLSPTLLAAFTSDHGEANKVLEKETVQSVPIEASAPVRRAESRPAVVGLESHELNQNTAGLVPPDEVESEGALPANHDSVTTR